MTFGLLLASACSGAAYTLAPGPAFLALLGIGASRGRRAGTLFLCGHFAGDILWASLSLVAIIGAQSIGSFIFDLLGLFCGTYLCVLGFRAVTVRRGATGSLSTEPRSPLARGLIFGLSNPKAYPVAVAMFTALLAGHAGQLSWSALPALLAAAAVGFILADLALISVVGAPFVRRFYRRHEVLVTRVSGILFLGFGLHAIASALPGIVRQT
ncbi:MAG: LysE family translocator [Acetobacteraceae bacterium]